ncbi:MAG: hypothetical protein VR68_09270 [Peptococcaceae bacterium BRH_c4a]|nr:MAG: hypothetical protein VR68_09270 [Peptococcaceae bacterium BRH_c4a]
MTADKLFLAEHGWQVEDIMKRNMGDGCWIALGPSAMWQLEKSGVEYSIPEDFYEVNELESLCTENHSMVENLCREMDDLIHAGDLKLKEQKLRPFMFHFFPLMILFDGIKSRIFMLQKVLGQFPRQQGVIHKSSFYPFGAFGICFSKNENLWSLILGLNGWDRDIVFLPGEPPENEGSLKVKTLGRLKQIAKKNISLSTFLRYFSKKNYRSLLATLNFFSNKGNIILNSDQNEFSSIMEKLNARGYGIFYLDADFADAGQHGAKSGLLGRLEIRQFFMSYFDYQGINFYPLLRERFEYLLGEVPCNFISLSERVEKTIKKLRVKALLNYGSPRATMHTFNQVVRNVGIPVITWQHGMVGDSNGKPTQFFGLTDQITSDISLVFGNQVEKLYKNCWATARVITVGSSRIDKLQINKDKKETFLKEKTILYATTSYYGNNWYCGIPGFNDRTFYLDQMKIMDILGRISANNKILVKLHPGNQPPWIETYQDSERIAFITVKPSFEELLLKSDVVILDLPSTVLLESVSSYLPVFVLLKHWRFSDQEHRLLSKRAVCHYSIDMLLESILLFMETGDYPAYIEDREFIKSYATHLDDELSGERAFRVVMDAIEGR